MSEHLVPSSLAAMIARFLETYIQETGLARDVAEKHFQKLQEIVKEQIKAPFRFEPFHHAILEYYTFGNDFFRPLIDFSRSSVRGKEELAAIDAACKRGENVILLANHQTEPDPQIISLLIEKEYPELAQKMIFVAGHRVVTDPISIPFSMGRNLLCINSKKYIDNPPEQKAEKLAHNQRTMKAMEEALKKGGACIYVAPSGGRDRKNSDGVIEVAPFNPESVEMFYLISQKAGTKTHFHPLTLSTYDILPPPDMPHTGLSEERITKFSPVHIVFGKEIAMETIVHHEDRKERRRLRADAIWNQVAETFKGL